MSSYPGDHSHPYLVHPAPVPPPPIPSNVFMPLAANTLADVSPQYAQAMALLLAAETFLSSAQDSRKPLELRVDLDKAALKLLAESTNHILQPGRSAA